MVSFFSKVPVVCSWLRKICSRIKYFIWLTSNSDSTQQQKLEAVQRQMNKISFLMLSVLRDTQSVLSASGCSSTDFSELERYRDM